MLSTIEGNQNGSSSNSTSSSQSHHNLSPGYTSQIPSPLTATPTSSELLVKWLIELCWRKFSICFSSHNVADLFSRSADELSFDGHHNIIWKFDDSQHKLPSIDAPFVD